MKLPAILAPKPRSAAECEAEIARLHGEAADAERLINEMAVARPSILLEGSDEQLEAHDTNRARQANRRDRAAMQVDKVRVERQAAVEREDQVRRQALYRAGKKARDARERLLREEYLPKAAALASVLARAAALSREIVAGNAELPVGAEPLGYGEPGTGPNVVSNFDTFQGRPFIPGVLGEPQFWPIEPALWGTSEPSAPEAPAIEFGRVRFADFVS